MAEDNEARAEGLQGQTGDMTRRIRTRHPVRMPRAKMPARVSRAAGNAVRPLRSLMILSMVGGLIATVALPAYGAWHQPAAEAVTLQQVAFQDAQSLVVASDSGGTELTRESYSATTAEEIAQKKAEEAAAEAAKAAAARARVTGSVAYSVPVDVAMIAPGAGEVRWPLTGGYTLGDGFGTRGGAHMGIDMLAAGGTPIYASAAGVVRVSQESYYGFGVAVVIDHVVGGTQVSTAYAHMIYGSRQVEAGQYVEAGQLIGLVGSTGRSTANHLHFEVTTNGRHIDPLAWLYANAG